MKQLLLLEMALSQNNNVLTLTKVSDTVINVATGQRMSMGLPPTLFKGVPEDGIYVCVIKDGLLHLEPYQAKGKKNVKS